VTTDPPADAPVTARDKVPAPPLSPAVTALGSDGTPKEVNDAEVPEEPLPILVVAVTLHRYVLG
jgi:hypothetical protein